MSLPRDIFTRYSRRGTGDLPASATATKGGKPRWALLSTRSCHTPLLAMAPKQKQPPPRLSNEQKGRLDRTGAIKDPPPPSASPGCPSSDALDPPAREAPTPSHTIEDSQTEEHAPDEIAELAAVKAQLGAARDSLGDLLCGTLATNYIEGKMRLSGRTNFRQLVSESADSSLRAAAIRLLTGSIPQPHALEALVPHLLCWDRGTPVLLGQDPASDVTFIEGRSLLSDFFEGRPLLRELLSLSTRAVAVKARDDPHQPWLYMHLMLPGAVLPSTAAVEASAVPASPPLKVFEGVYFGQQGKRVTPKTLLGGRAYEETKEVRRIPGIVHDLRTKQFVGQSRILAAVQSEDQNAARLARYEVHLDKTRACVLTDRCLDEPNQAPLSAHTACRTPHDERRTKHTTRRVPHAAICTSQVLVWVPLPLESVANFFEKLGVHRATDMDIDALEALLVLLGETYSLSLNMRMHAGALLRTWSPVEACKQGSASTILQAAHLVVSRPHLYSTVVQCVLQMVLDCDGTMRELCRVIVRACVAPLGVQESTDDEDLLAHAIYNYLLALAKGVESHASTEGATPLAYWPAYPPWANGNPLPHSKRRFAFWAAAPVAFALKRLEKSEGWAKVQDAALAMLQEEFDSDRGWKPTEGFDTVILHPPALLRSLSTIASRTGHAVATRIGS